MGDRPQTGNVAAKTMSAGSDVLAVPKGRLLTCVEFEEAQCGG